VFIKPQENRMKISLRKVKYKEYRKPKDIKCQHPFEQSTLQVNSLN